MKFIKTFENKNFKIYENKKEFSKILFIIFNKSF